MGKRGRKVWEAGDGGCMPLREIARRTGWSKRTVCGDYRSACQKLLAVPGSFEILLEVVQASAAMERELIRAASAECNRDFVEKWSD